MDDDSVDAEPAGPDSQDDTPRGSRRGTLTKIGAVAAGAWVAPSILSVPAAAQSIPGPCNCTSVLLSVYATFLQNIPANGLVSFNTIALTSNLTFTPPTTATLPNSGIYRVTYGAFLSTAGAIRSLTLKLNSVSIPGTALYLTGGWAETSVLVSATAGDTLQVANFNALAMTLQPNPGFTDRGASLVIEQVS